MGRGPLGRPQCPPQELRWEPRVLTTWGALGRWVGDPAEAAERVGVPDLPWGIFGLWLQEELGEAVFKALF